MQNSWYPCNQTVPKTGCVEGFQPATICKTYCKINDFTNTDRILKQKNSQITFIKSTHHWYNAPCLACCFWCIQRRGGGGFKPACHFITEARHPTFAEPAFGKY